MIEFGGGLGKSGGSFRSRFYGDVRMPSLEVTDGDIEVSGKVLIDGVDVIGNNTASINANFTDILELQKEVADIGWCADPVDQDPNTTTDHIMISTSDNGPILFEAAEYHYTTTFAAVGTQEETRSQVAISTVVAPNPDPSIGGLSTMWYRSYVRGAWGVWTIVPFTATNVAEKLANLQSETTALQYLSTSQGCIIADLIKRVTALEKK